MRVVLIIFCFAVFTACSVSAGSLITNGSFEDNGAVANIKTVKPNGWGVNIPSTFSGDIRNDWATEGTYAVRLYTNKYATFTAGQQAVVSQEVDLTDANEIIFDIYLRGKDIGSLPWNGSKVTAFINIDNSPNDLWVSDVNANGIYYDVNVPIGSYTGMHTLYMGIRVDVNEKINVIYQTYWDFAKFDAFCGGFGYYEADFNRDCYVDFIDVDILAQNWLGSDLVDANDLIDVWQDGQINLSDFSVLANQWLLCTDWQNANCVEYPLDLDADINIDGIVNFLDYGVLIANWGVPTNLKADIDGSDVVDYNDLAVMKEQWLEKSWLYRY